MTASHSSTNWTNVILRKISVYGILIRYTFVVDEERTKQGFFNLHPMPFPRAETMSYAEGASAGVWFVVEAKGGEIRLAMWQY